MNQSIKCATVAVEETVLSIGARGTQTDQQAGGAEALPEVLPDEELLLRSEDTFSMLASAARLKLVWLLRDGEHDVTTLAAATNSTPQAVSQHLTKLRYAGLVASRREGRHQMYRVDDPHVLSLVEQVVEHHEDLRDRGLFR